MCIYHHLQTEWFSVQSGDRQGCVLSSVLLRPTIDRIMSQALFRQEFAKDHQLPEHTGKDRQDRHINQTGLNVNTSKTQMMYINITPPASVSMNGNPYEQGLHLIKQPEQGQLDTEGH